MKKGYARERKLPAWEIVGSTICVLGCNKAIRSRQFRVLPRCVFIYDCF